MSPVSLLPPSQLPSSSIMPTISFTPPFIWPSAGTHTSTYETPVPVVLFSQNNQTAAG